MIDKKNFVKDVYGWELKQPLKKFLGKEVSVQIDTKIDSDHPDKEIFDEQLETLKYIYANWDELSILIEKEILGYENISKEELQRVLKEPNIWIGMDDSTNRPMDDNGWNFVLGVTESEDFGWHVEFELGTHIETWAGG